MNGEKNKFIEININSEYELSEQNRENKKERKKRDRTNENEIWNIICSKFCVFKKKRNKWEAKYLLFVYAP